MMKKKKLYFLIIIISITLVIGIGYFHGTVSSTNEEKQLELIKNATKCSNIQILKTTEINNLLCILYRNTKVKETALCVLYPDKIISSLYRVESALFSCVESDFGSCHISNHNKEYMIIYGDNSELIYNKYLFFDGLTENIRNINQDCYIIDIYPLQLNNPNIQASYLKVH